MLGGIYIYIYIGRNRPGGRGGSVPVVLEAGRVAVEGGVEGGAWGRGGAGRDGVIEARLFGGDAACGDCELSICDEMVREPHTA